MVVQATSAGYNAGKFARILINGEKVNVKPNTTGNYRGMHIVMINPDNCKVVFAEVFDTYKSSKEFEWWKNDVDVPDGTIIAGACSDDCVKCMTDAVKYFFRFLGSKIIFNIEYQQSYAFIAVAGAVSKNKLYEQAGENGLLDQAQVT